MKKILSAVWVAVLLLGVRGLALAQATWNPPRAVVPGGTSLRATDFADVLNNVALFLIFASVIIVVIFIIWAGITYTAAGADQTKVKAAKDRLKQGIIGGLIIFGIGTIIETIRIFIQNPNYFFY
ncbi:MAG: hypothetical protein A3B99_02780 [Candidatus Yanofskybacteria bacterium RIFCSPHIGHO2_02_FULL_44_12b]|uniref:Uncharacterized protein n=2 Tax=Candidatus Yanofskyibacteriota TaxID=1752733 RepID=A0A1F8GLY2_9BACT|nr:MAG: hypothetical protein UW79_C0017G0008 [Candidatus Yanofskybacteria bacterium GW2011_GWA2_44_9]OGN05026.1 MAG: hypothetical protein A2659_02635 [Candidatus Yanofskybacteria bacterium RIFCSPHIGHO2_01_FULL_44_24]OGN16215.1 MAG: hypothetical protein A3B99_02780 [Candidatus Yanofskybacteria bacterium RIFCSPHIGHO2_02_FULL_44_12b]OGN26341.1 MAG: hypothetical protein A2925_00410 [Candidatus Yanofskybacteria bacterium RIFCSPLOWO2_01_FULL_44_22]